MRDLLRQAPLFAQCAQEDLDWLAEQVEEVHLNAGDLLFAEGQQEVSFYVLLEGELQITKHLGGQEMPLATHHAGAFTGEVPLLTGTPYIATARAGQSSHLLRIGADAFQQMLSLCPAITRTVFKTMAERMQGLESQLRQREKLAALGTLAAGLAHELNNPAAAARRAAAQVRETLLTFYALDLSLQQRLTLAQFEALTQAAETASQPSAAVPALDPLAESDREDEMTTWLEAHGSADGWKLAPTLVRAGLTTDRLEDVASLLPAEALGDTLAWLEARLSLSGLVGELEESSARISDLVKAVKSYSYMDQAPQQEVDVHEGLESTLTILGHKLKGGVSVIRQYDRSLPRITAYGSELNQVWTNLIDNAIDAMAGQGRLSIHTAREGTALLVEIADTGSGIAPDIQPRIFEPFFTTKGVGQGSGLGLDIAYRIVVGRHHGDICVVSRPGDTRFQVRLPLSS